MRVNRVQKGSSGAGWIAGGVVCSGVAGNHIVAGIAGVTGVVNRELGSVENVVGLYAKLKR